MSKSSSAKKMLGRLKNQIEIGDDKLTERLSNHIAKTTAGGGGGFGKHCFSRFTEK